MHVSLEWIVKSIELGYHMSLPLDLRSKLLLLVSQELTMASYTLVSLDYMIWKLHLNAIFFKTLSTYQWLWMMLFKILVIYVNYVIYSSKVHVNINKTENIHHTLPINVICVCEIETYLLYIMLPVSIIKDFIIM